MSRDSNTEKITLVVVGFAYWEQNEIPPDV